MSNYTPTYTNAAGVIKDATHTPVLGADIGTEFDAIQTVVNSKVNTSDLGTGVATFLATPSSANLAAALTDETGTGAAVFANTPTLVTPVLGVPTSGTLTYCTGLPVSTGVSGLGTGIATFLATPSSANLASALTDELGTGLVPFAAESTFTPVLNFGGATTGITYGTQTATYSKIGSRVFFDIDIVLTSKGTAVGVATITGLPAASASRAEALLNTTGVSLATTDIPQAYITASTISLVYTDITTGAGSSISNTSLSNTSTIRISGHYKV